MRMKTPVKLGLLTSLYLSQGLPFGFFTQALPVLLRKQGLSLPAIGLANLLALPWALKFLWAPLMDRYGSERLGRRRGYILPLQFLSAALLLGLALPEGTVSVPALLVAVLLVNLLAATQDVATDGLAVDLLESEELRLGQRRAGGRLPGGDDSGRRVDAHHLRRAGLAPHPAEPGRAAARGHGASGALPRAALPRPPEREREHGPLAPRVPAVLGAPPRRGRVVHPARPLQGGRAPAPRACCAPSSSTSGLGLSEVGWMLGFVGFTTGLVGALLGGALVHRLGRRRALLVFGILQAGAVLLYAMAARGASLPVLALVCGVEHLTSGMATAALFTVMMEMCRPEHAATDYTVQASLVVVATGAAAAVSGFSAQALGYAWHFTLSAVVCAVAVAWVAFTFHPPRTLVSRGQPEVS